MGGTRLKRNWHASEVYIDFVVVNMVFDPGEQVVLGVAANFAMIRFRLAVDRMHATLVLSIATSTHHKYQTGTNVASFHGQVNTATTNYSHSQQATAESSHPSETPFLLCTFHQIHVRLLAPSSRPSQPWRDYHHPCGWHRP